MGNLADLSPRAAEVLSGVDFIAAETVSYCRKLLSLLSLPPKKLISYRESNRHKQINTIIAYLQQNYDIALVCDAGTPGISDPGQELVAQCHELKIPVTSIPGPCAMINAIAMSGLPTQKISFFGFLPRSTKACKQTLQEISTSYGHTIVLYVPPHRLKLTLHMLAEVLPPHTRAFLIKEMTKKFERYYWGNIKDLISSLPATPPKGEHVLLLHIPPLTKTAIPAPHEVIQEYRWLRSMNLGAKQCTRLLNRYRGWKAKDIYSIISSYSSSKEH